MKYYNVISYVYQNIISIRKYENKRSVHNNGKWKKTDNFS